MLAGSVGSGPSSSSREARSTTAAFHCVNTRPSARSIRSARGGDPVTDPRVGRGDEHLDVLAADGPVEPRLVGGMEVGAQHPGDLDLAEPDVRAHPGAVTEPSGGGLPVRASV